MKKILITFIIIYSPQLHAQPYDAYKDEYLGWIKVYKYKGASKTVQVEEKKYSIAQLSIIDSFVNWMQASYIPKGAMGDVIKYLSPKTGTYNENKYNKAVPQSYGARAMTYRFLKKQNGKWTPVNNLGYGWSIAANEIPLSYRHQDFETGKVCVFTLPLLSEHDGEEKALYDLSSHPVINKYIHQLCIKRGSIQRINHVILSKYNINPFVQLTIGEALQLAEEALPVKLAEELKNIKANNIGRPDEIERLSGYQEQNFAKCRETLILLKEKYRNRLTEPAYGGYSMLSDLMNGYDFFTKAKVNEEGRIDKTEPLLRVRPEMEALCKTDKPQWIMIKWYGGSINEESFKHMHESIINNVNFDYIYKFFFEPEKVKAMAYIPRRSPTYEEAATTIAPSPDKQKLKNDLSVIYFEDFSTTPEGKMPQGWISDLNREGKKVSVVNEVGLTWARLNGNIFQVSKLNKILPQNFTASFELFVRKGFHWGTPAIEFYIAGKKKYEDNYENYIMAKVRPGFDERDGWATVNIKTQTKSFFPGEVAVPGFSNNKAINRTTVTINKIGGQVTVHIGNTKVFDEVNAALENVLLDHIYFKEYNQNWDVEDYYITNIKITKK